MTDAADILREHGIIAAKSDASGRFYTTCPQCSPTRKLGHQKAEVLGVTVDAEGVRWGCNHCGWTGGARFEPRPKPNGAARARCVAEYVYLDEHRNPYLRVRRLSLPNGGKSYPQYHRANDEWVKGAPCGPKIPYRLPELLAAPADAPVFIAEGEKCADRLAAAGLIATSASGGAGKWRPELNQWFAGRTVHILPDNDTPGHRHAQQVASNLHSVAADVRIVELPGLAEGKDVYDWLERGNTPETLISLSEEAPVWKPTDPPTDEQPPFPNPRDYGAADDADADRYSEDALALRFTARHGDNFRYVADWGRWYCWDGHLWRADAKLTVFDAARVICRGASGEVRGKSKSLAAKIASARTRAKTWHDPTRLTPRPSTSGMPIIYCSIRRQARATCARGKCRSLIARTT
jgi:hypothetical protein